MVSSGDYLRLAYQEAVKSGDLSTQNGAVLVDPTHGGVVAEGWNDIHKPLIDLPERRQRPLKYAWTEHAERAAIFDAAKRGIATSGLWLYCPWLACSDCGRAIVYAGITKVIRHRIEQHKSRPDWAASIAEADQMLREAGVEIEEYTGTLGIQFRFCGDVISV